MRNRLLPTLTVSALAAVSLGIGAGTASAAAPEDEADRPRVERACARVPNLTTRTQNVLDRIQGDEETRGSLLWLDRRIANAAENDRTELVEVLTNRRNVREASIDVLEQRLVALGDIAELCADAGL
ncbi:MAG: hypothetical protein AAFP84_19845 [Actinomycetota bacterium]